MRNHLRHLEVLFVLLLIAGCAQLGLAPADNFDSKLAYAYGTNTAIREASTQALTAHKITSADMEKVLTVNDQARLILDSAKTAAAAGNTQDANAKLLMATSILTSIRTFLNSKKGT